MIWPTGLFFDFYHFIKNTKFRPLSKLKGKGTIDFFDCMFTKGMPTGSIKVRLRWFGAVLQCKCKFVVFPCTFNITIRIIHH